MQRKGSKIFLFFQAYDLATMGTFPNATTRSVILPAFRSNTKKQVTRIETLKQSNIDFVRVSASLITTNQNGNSDKIRLR